MGGWSVVYTAGASRDVIGAFYTTEDNRSSIEVVTDGAIGTLAAVFLEVEILYKTVTWERRVRAFFCDCHNRFCLTDTGAIAVLVGRTVATNTDSRERR